MQLNILGSYFLSIGGSSGLFLGLERNIWTHLNTLPQV